MRIAVPSWVIPGTYVDNLRFLEDKPDIDGVELLFFLYDPEVEALLNAEFDQIQGYGNRFAFSAHLPDPLLPAHETLVERVAPLATHFVVHPTEPRESSAQAELLESWERRWGTETSPARFLIENTRSGRHEAALAQRGDAALCLDTGHLLLAGLSPAAFYKAHADRIAEIHLHGIDPAAALRDGRLADHRPVRPDATWFAELAPCLKHFSGILNIEVFSWAEAETTLMTLRQWGLIRPRS